MATTNEGYSMKRNSKNDLQPNDVAIILRPHVGKDGEWDQTYEVIISGFGPVTISKEAMDDMIGMAVLLASVVPLMESNEEVAAEIMEHCNKFYAHNAIGVNYDMNHNSFAGLLDKDLIPFDINTPTVGGVQ